jgi:hypothetical protein
MARSVTLPSVRRSVIARELTACVGILAIVLAVPFGWRVVLGLWGPDTRDEVPSYLPALERARPRNPFVETPIQELRDIQPGIVIIGDSMAGRIDEDRLTALSQTPVAPVLMNATGSAYWYLVFKNYVVASGVRPRWVLVFFRDTSMTDVTFRLDGPYRLPLDGVARSVEPELNAVVARRSNGVWAGVHLAADAAYRTKAARAWIEPGLNRWPALLVAAPGRDQTLLDRVNATFTLDKLRSMAQADLASADERDADFQRYVDASVLPLLLSGARDAGLRLCFVRVMRRPVDGHAPPESPRLRHYLNDMREYVESRGGAFMDDHDDPELARLPYADGDHISRDARVPYTDRFWPRLQQLAR